MIKKILLVLCSVAFLLVSEGASAQNNPTSDAKDSTATDYAFTCVVPRISSINCGREDTNFRLKHHGEIYMDFSKSDGNNCLIFKVIKGGGPGKKVSEKEVCPGLGKVHLWTNTHPDSVDLRVEIKSKWFQLSKIAIEGKYILIGEDLSNVP